MATNMKARLGKVAKKRPKKKPLAYVGKNGHVYACAARKKTPKKQHTDLGGHVVSKEWLKHRKQMHCIIYVTGAGVIHAKPNAIGVKKGLVRKSGTLTGKKKGTSKKRGRPSKQKASRGRKKTAKAKKKATKKTGKGKKKCKVCKKGMRQKKGRGRPRLKHAGC
jgi:hypothetical protein